MNRYCLWCNEEIVVTFSWSTIITTPKPKRLCEPCDKQFQRLEGDRCHRCGRMSRAETCQDCLWWENYFSNKDPLEFNESLFLYNESMQEMIAKWKYRGNYILIDAFQDEFRERFLSTYSFLNDAIVIPIPLSGKRIRERGFNQAEQLAQFLPTPMGNVLSRQHSEKQAKKSRYDRIGEENPFKVHGNINKPAILVDDIYTTGATIRHAAAKVKEAGCPQVYSFTLIRG